MYRRGMHFHDPRYSVATVVIVHILELMLYDLRENGDNTRVLVTGDNPSTFMAPPWHLHAHVSTDEDKVK